MQTTESIRKAAEELAEQALGRISELVAEVDQRQAEIAELRAMVRRYSPATIKKSARTNGRVAKDNSKRYTSADSVARVAYAIGQLPEGEAFDARTLMERIPKIHKSTVYNCLETLRDREAIRLAERQRRPGAPHASKCYRVMDEKTLNELMNQ